MYITPCDYCIEEECKGKHNCHCDTCANLPKCVKFLRPTIRITTKCTQQCSHCLYSCSPKNTEHMSLETAELISKFLSVNRIQLITIMGGEFFCNPEWDKIIPVLCQSVDYCRLVTNGDWAEALTDKVMTTLSPFKEILKISISKDRWHTNQYVDKAAEACKLQGFKYNVTSPEEDTEETIIPVGRGSYHYSFFGTFSCYCHDPQHKYSFLIDEKALIYKCSAGSWDYAKVQDYVTGNFSKCFKEYNQKFYNIFVPNCTTCRRAYAKKDS